MEPIVYFKTSTTPAIEFYPNGNLLIRGNLTGDKITQLNTPVLSFCRRMRSKEVIVDLDVQEVGDLGLKLILDLIKTLELNSRVRKIDVRWYSKNRSSVIYEYGELLKNACSDVFFDLTPEESFEYSVF